MDCPTCNAEYSGSATVCAVCGSALSATSSSPAGRVPPDALPPGTRLHSSAFVIDEVLGQGGFGITYLGRDTHLERRVAIKEFFPFGCERQGSTVQPRATGSHGATALAGFHDARQKFLNEARLLARFHHPGIVNVHTVFEENDTAYMVMEYLHGKTLSEVLQDRDGSLPEHEAVYYVERVGEALAAVHEAGLLHRDVKPENVMVCDDGRVTLIDFGAAREFATHQTQGHSIVVTPGYAPLEQYAARAQRGAYTDVYGLAATLYHLLTGQIPLAASDRAMGLELPALRQHNPSISEPVAHAVARAMETEIAKRPQSVREFLNLMDNEAMPLSGPHVATPFNSHLTDHSPHEIAPQSLLEGSEVNEPFVVGSCFIVGAGMLLVLLTLGRVFGVRLTWSILMAAIVFFALWMIGKYVGRGRWGLFAIGAGLFILWVLTRALLHN